MRVSRALIPTLREDPGEAETVSHRLMLRAGLIRKVAAGIYTYLPLGLRIIRNIEAIVREEMDRAGAQEILMPIASPAELWKETGRWDFYGKELLRFKDRHERDFCLGPTHEEVVTDLFRREVRSYRQFPANFYQIQTKFRDEIRPRFGLMRGREFIMKDAYSFAASDVDTLQKISPFYHLDDVTAPIQIHYGTEDGKLLSGTPPQWSVKLTQRLRDAGKQVELLQYEGEGHSFIGQPWFDFMTRTLRFFDRYVKNNE